MRKKRLLITGISGLLGSNIAYCLKDRYEILGLYNTHRVYVEGIEVKKADILSPESLEGIFKEFKPEIVLHCAANSEVDFCEDHPDLAKRVNVEGTKNIVDQMSGNGAKLIYISTDTVYEEQGDRLVTEEDPINPPNFYGVTKYEGEKEALKREGTVVLRTTFFGWNIQDKNSLGEWVVAELSSGRKIQGFNDIFFSSLYTFDFAEMLDKVMQKGISGVYNFGSSNSISKCKFTLIIADLFGLDKNLINPSSVDDFHLRAKRRKSLRLDVSKIEKALGCSFPKIEEQAKKFFNDSQEGIQERIKMQNLPSSYPDIDFIPYGRQSVDETDIQAVVDVLKSKNLTQGPVIVKFEEALGNLTGAKYAVAVDSGTAALHVACLAAGISQGDEVITSANTFVASANCAVYCGGTTVLADIDPKTYNMRPDELEKKITAKTKAVIPVHFAGQSCDMKAIREIVLKKEKEFGHKIYIIEDASHAIGSIYDKKRIGCCAYSDIATFSFHPVKHITTAEGGAVLTNDEELRDRSVHFRSHGITSAPEEVLDRDSAFERDNSAKNKEVMRPWYYEQQSLGYNYRTTDIQCALGLSQLKKLDLFMKRRREIFEKYNRAFSRVKWIQAPTEKDLCRTNFHLYVILIDFKKIGISRANFIFKLREKKIQTQVHYIPVYRQPFHQEHFGFKCEDFPETEHYYERCISLPIYPAMSNRDVDRVIESVIALG